MPDSTLANLTAATAATGGLFYGTQSSADKKFTLTAAGAALIEAANASAQITALGAVASGGALGTPSSGTLTNCTGLPTNGLVDDAVTLAKMAAGTAGNLISYDASGNPVAVATGTAGQVLTSNGAGAAPTMQTSSSSFNPASPGPIGGTTPAAGTFTELNLPNNGILRASGSVIIRPTSGGNIVYDTNNHNFRSAGFADFLTLTANGLLIAGNSQGLAKAATGVIKITNGSTGGGILEMPQVTSGGTPSSNSASIYSKDVGGTAKMFTMNEAGVETQLGL